jgi:hypothetical protein
MEAKYARGWPHVLSYAAISWEVSLGGGARHVLPAPFWRLQALVWQVGAQIA